MKHNILKLVLCLILISIGFVGCTDSGGSSSMVGSIADAVKDIISPDPSVNTAEKQVAEIQKKLNQDEAYALTKEDIQFLQSQGLVSDSSELKAWVK